MAKSKRSITGKRLAARLLKLKRGPTARHLCGRDAGRRRGSLSPRQRREVLAKTAGRCHVCGGQTAGDWHADH